MGPVAVFLVASAVLCLVPHSHALNFILKSSSSQCFFKSVDSGHDIRIYYYVLSGGNFDIDVKVIDPNKNTLIEKERSSFDVLKIPDTLAGDYELCFSNAFSTITEKEVIFYLILDGEDPFVASSGISGAYTQAENQTNAVRNSLHKAQMLQVRLKSYDTISHSFIESLNSEVLYWSAGQALAIITIGLIQIYVVRSFFKQPNNNAGKWQTSSSAGLHTGIH